MSIAGRVPPLPGWQRQHRTVTPGNTWSGRAYAWIDSPVGVADVAHHRQSPRPACRDAFSSYEGWSRKPGTAFSIGRLFVCGLEKPCFRLVIPAALNSRRAVESRWNDGSWRVFEVSVRIAHHLWCRCETRLATTTNCWPRVSTCTSGRLSRKAAKVDTSCASNVPLMGSMAMRGSLTLICRLL